MSKDLKHKHAELESHRSRLEKMNVSIENGHAFAVTAQSTCVTKITNQRAEVDGKIQIAKRLVSSILREAQKGGLRELTIQFGITHLLANTTFNQ